MSEDEPEDAERDERVTAPMQDYGNREIGIGIAVLVVGLIVTFLLPFVF